MYFIETINTCGDRIDRSPLKPSHFTDYNFIEIIELATKCCIATQ